MGEMADYILNGDDCQGCGEYLGNGPGYPRWCARCRPRRAARPRAEEVMERKIKCPACSRRFASPKAVADHVRARSVDIPQHAPNLAAHRAALTALG